MSTEADLNNFLNSKKEDQPPKREMKITDAIPSMMNTEADLTNFLNSKKEAPQPQPQQEVKFAQ